MADHRSTPPSIAFIDLPALLSSASDQALLSDSVLSAHMVEYSCWELRIADWHTRQRPRPHPEFKGWIHEGRALFDQLDEMKKIAHNCLRSGGTSSHRPLAEQRLPRRAEVPGSTDWSR
jgi:hypothetical protein